MTPKPSPEEAARADLLRIRGEIERVDRALIELIAQRMELGRAVGAAKRAAGLPALDPAREAAVIRRASEIAREMNAPEEDVRYIFWQLIGMSRRAQLTGD